MRFPPIVLRRKSDWWGAVMWSGGMLVSFIGACGVFAGAYWTGGALLLAGSFAAGRAMLRVE